jgi:hypothetical protein
VGDKYTKFSVQKQHLIESLGATVRSHGLPSTSSKYGTGKIEILSNGNGGGSWSGGKGLLTLKLTVFHFSVQLLCFLGDDVIWVYLHSIEEKRFF